MTEQKVKCLVCGREFTAKDALSHTKWTGHNRWELVKYVIRGK